MIATAPLTGDQKPPTKKRAVRRRRTERPDENGARFFLVERSDADQVDLGEEAPTENDAMVTAFRTGGTYAVVTEWKTERGSDRRAAGHQEGGSPARKESRNK